LHSWDKLERNLERLVDELQLYGHNVDVREESKVHMMSQEPDEEVYAFVNRALDSALCRCDTNSDCELRLWIGSYKKGRIKPKPECLCLLVAQDESLRQWHELLIHDPPRRQ
jgi:hypothetical protein